MEEQWEIVPENLKDLVDFRVSGEQWLPRAHLREDRTNRPHVNPGRVLASTQEDLRGAIPQRNHLNRC